LEERSDFWVNVTGNVVFAPDENSFVWLSTGGNENQIQVRRIDGDGCETIPTGDARVDAIVGVVAEPGTVWFQGRKGSPENRFVFRVSLDGKGGVEAVSEKPGWHDAKLLSAKGLWTYTYESVSTPPKVEVRDAKGETVVELPADPRSCQDAARLRLPEFFDVPGENGTALRACLYRPKNRAHSSRLPLLVAVYGGPGVQSVRNAWDVRVDLRSQRFAEEGVLVLKTDNRGSSGRGNAFERQIAKRFGSVDVEDQVRGVRYLVDELKIADPSRVAVSGWSYGGYLAAMCLLAARDVFKAAVAGAPVVSWCDYDACYTERYMGSPESHEAAYARADVSKYAANLSGRLLIIHGLRDENVLFAHTTRLARALNASPAVYDLLILPEERHSVTGFENRVLVERRVFEHVMASLR
jgi:dipeptidyl-peptidase-4